MYEVWKHIRSITIKQTYYLYAATKSEIEIWNEIKKSYRYWISPIHIVLHPNIIMFFRTLSFWGRVDCLSSQCPNHKQFHAQKAQIQAQGTCGHSIILWPTVSYYRTLSRVSIGWWKLLILSLYCKMWAEYLLLI